MKLIGELPTTFELKRNKYYVEPFGENWGAVLSRLTENQCNFVGNEYGEMTHKINTQFDELTRCHTELDRLRSQIAELKIVGNETIKQYEFAKKWICAAVDSNYEPDEVVTEWQQLVKQIEEEG